jgi:hypothetical protein
MYLSEKIIEFNKNYSETLLIEILNDVFLNRPKCRICNRDIFYLNSKFRTKRDDITIIIIGKSFMSKKKHGEQLEVCEHCLSEKFPNYKNLNKAKIFNIKTIVLWESEYNDKNFNINEFLNKNGILF